MAELRRVGGHLEARRSLGGFRNLLPAEVAICEFIGITEQDYWEFLRLQDEYNGQRPEGYELVPDVRNEAVTILAVAQLVIGLALVALAPKPKPPGQQKAPPNLQTESITGRQSFTPTNNFNSSQELAKLGDVIPLVYTRVGVRTSGKLLWSQMLSLGRMQQLKAIFLFSHGELAQPPEFDGFAIGDTLLENYALTKVGLYFRTNGGRIQKANKYSEGTLKDGKDNDVFLIPDDVEEKKKANFSGCRTPSTQSQFGAYGAMPNGNFHRPEYELVMIGDDLDDDSKDDANEKKKSCGRVTRFKPQSLKATTTAVNIESAITVCSHPWTKVRSQTVITSPGGCQMSKVRLIHGVSLLMKPSRLGRFI